MTRKLMPSFKSLSSQLLVLTIIFVVIVQIFIYVPSIAQFRKNYLDQRLVAAQIAALSLEEAEGREISEALEKELLDSAEIQAVIVVTDDARQLILSAELPSSLTGVYDLREVSFWALVKDAFKTLQHSGEGSIQVQGRPINTRHQSVQIVMREGPLYNAMIAESKTVLGVTVIISLATAILVYLTLLCLLVRPTRRMTENLTQFAKEPENPDNIMMATARRNEIGLLEKQIVKMQQEIRQALAQKTRLANLGMAISKINHDLKNILSTAQLSRDYLEHKSDNKQQKRVVSRLYTAVDNAIDLCERTLKYGKVEEPPPVKKLIPLQKIVAEAKDALKESAGKNIKWICQIPSSFKVFADKGQLFRALFNLCHNAIEAMGEKGTLTVLAKEKGNRQLIGILDTGPGVSEKVREDLFLPFAGSTKEKGSGLGLAIAQEMIRGHGGEIILEKSDKTGSLFFICLPKRN